MINPISDVHAYERMTDNTLIDYCKQCKDCIYWNGGDDFSNDYEKSSCAVYAYPMCKPAGVINNTEECEYREVE